MPFTLELDVLRSALAEYGAPLLILSREQVRRQYRDLCTALPGVSLYYALKPLPHPELLQVLDSEGACFDVCSNGEVDVVRQLGIAPERVIHTHPIKRPSDIRHALDYGCRTFVVDNIDEIEKCAAFKDELEVLLRLSFRSKDAIVDLSKKFGAAPEEAIGLLHQARDRGLHTRGLCFHVGSQNLHSYKYIEAIQFCRQLFNLAALDGIILDVLDIGGGFPVPYQENVTPIDQFCEPIRNELERLFPTTTIFAEPGRFIAAPAVTLLASVMGRSQRQGIWWYYLDDGVYGSYSGQIYDHATYQVYALKTLLGEAADEPRLSVLAGPTCDSIDVISESILLPELSAGDVLVSPMMGAYTSASASEFNFFPKTRIVTID